MASCPHCQAPVVRGVGRCSECGMNVPTSRWRKIVGVIAIVSVPLGMLVLIYGSRCFGMDRASGTIELRSERLGSFAFEANTCRRRGKDKPPVLVIGASGQAGRELLVRSSHVLLRVRQPEGGWREARLDRRSCRHFSVVVDSVKHGKRESTRAYHGRVYLTCDSDKTAVSTAVHFRGC
jgi:hypothetical protein